MQQEKIPSSKIGWYIMMCVALSIVPVLLALSGFSITATYFVYVLFITLCCNKLYQYNKEFNMDSKSIYLLLTLSFFSEICIATYPFFLCTENDVTFHFKILYAFVFLMFFLGFFASCEKFQSFNIEKKRAEKLEQHYKSMLIEQEEFNRRIQQEKEEGIKKQKEYIKQLKEQEAFFVQHGETAKAQIYRRSIEWQELLLSDPDKALRLYREEHRISPTANVEDNIPSQETNVQDECYVYLMLDMSNNAYKIGISNNPEVRESTLQSEKPSIVKICEKKYVHRKIAAAVEKHLHSEYRNRHMRGEWFSLSDEDVKRIIKYLE